MTAFLLYTGRWVIRPNNRAAECIETTTSINRPEEDIPTVVVNRFCPPGRPARPSTGFYPFFPREQSPTWTLPTLIVQSASL